MKGNECHVNMFIKKCPITVNSSYRVIEIISTDIGNAMTK